MNLNDDFWFGFWVFVFPFLAVGVWVSIEEKLKSKKAKKF